MNDKNLPDTSGNTTRTFNDEETSVLIRALIAVRPHLSKDEQEIVNDIIKDGWS